MGELVEEIASLQSAFDARHDEVLGKPNAPVELAEQDLAHRVGIAERLAALDLERDGLDLGVELDLAQAELDLLAARSVGQVLEEDVDAAFTAAVRQLVVLQQVAQHLGEVGLSGAEEAGHPHAHDVTGLPAVAEGLTRVGEGVEDALELVLDLVGDDELAHLGGQRRVVEHLDHALDLDADVSLDDLPHGGHATGPLLQVIFTAR